MCDYSIIPILAAASIFSFILIRGLNNLKKKIEKSPKTDQFIPKVTKGKSQSKQESGAKRKKISDKAIGEVFFFALFSAPIAWFVGQLGFLYMTEIGWNVCVSDPWYGNTSILLVVIAVLGFQVFRYSRK